MIKTKEHISSNNLDATGVSDDNKIQAIKLLNITDTKYTAILNSQEGNKLTKLKELLSINA
jgi:hypothetical protein